MSDREESCQVEEVVSPPSPLEFLKKVRQKMIDSNPAIKREMDPEGAAQRLILRLAKDHFQIEEKRGSSPAVRKKNYACQSITGGLCEAEGGRFLGIVVDEQFTIVFQESGGVEIKATKDTADFMPGGEIKKVSLAPTGAIMPRLSPETMGVINEILSSTITYLGVFRDRMAEPETLPDTLVFPETVRVARVG